MKLSIVFVGRPIELRQPLITAKSTLRSERYDVKGSIVAGILSKFIYHGANLHLRNLVLLYTVSQSPSSHCLGGQQSM